MICRFCGLYVELGSSHVCPAWGLPVKLAKNMPKEEYERMKLMVADDMEREMKPNGDT